MLIYICVAVILFNKQALVDYVDQTGDYSTACFVIFKTPLRCLNSGETLDEVLEMALQLEKEYPIDQLLTEIKQK